jgi:hypothetical protein
MLCFSIEFTVFHFYLWKWEQSKPPYIWHIPSDVRRQKDIMLDMVKHELFSVIITCLVFCGIVLQLQNVRFCARKKKHDGCNMKMVLIAHERFN